MAFSTLADSGARDEVDSFASCTPYDDEDCSRPASCTWGSPVDSATAAAWTSAGGAEPIDALFPAALSSLMAFSTSSCAVGCNVLMGTSSLLASASFEAHRRWKDTNDDDVLGRVDRRVAEVRDVIVLGRIAAVNDGVEMRRNAARRMGNLSIDG